VNDTATAPVHGPAPARVNRDGDPCPPWCVTDHGKYSFHGSERITVEAPQYHLCGARAIKYSGIGGGQIQVSGDGIVALPCSEAGDLAALIEELAAATPAQHRELAAAIRRAAAAAAGTAES
jgi:hypothetical protein